MDVLQFSTSRPMHFIFCRHARDYAFFFLLKFINARARRPLGHVVLISRQWMQNQSTETIRAGLRGLRRGRSLSVSVHYWRP